MNASKQADLVTKLQAFAGTLDIYRARVEIGTNDHNRDVVWLVWEAYGMQRVRRHACGLTSHGIRYIKKCMKEVESKLD
jgi:hypothetical protein